MARTPGGGRGPSVPVVGPDAHERPGGDGVGARGRGGQGGGRVVTARRRPWRSTISTAVASSGTAMTGAITQRTPRPMRAAAVPRSSSPVRTAETAAWQAGSTTTDGARRRRSRSYTVSGPSASSSEENIGLSARKLPWAATWARAARSRAAHAALAVAPAPVTTSASACSAAMARTSPSAAGRFGPATRATPPPAAGDARPPASHTAALGATVVGRPASVGSAPHARPCRAPVGTTTTGAAAGSPRGASRRSSRRSAVRPTRSSAARRDRRASSRRRPNSRYSTSCSTRSPGPRSNSRMRRPTTVTAWTRPWKATNSTSARSPSARRRAATSSRPVPGPPSSRVLRVRSRTAFSTVARRCWSRRGGPPERAASRSALRRRRSSSRPAASSSSSGGRTGGRSSAPARRRSAQRSTRRASPSRRARLSPVRARSASRPEAEARISVAPRVAR
jgi:hypothetical protein